MKKQKILHYYDHFEEILLFAMFLAMVIIIFLQVVMRYAFNNSLAWTEEMGRYLFIWLSWLGISAGEKRGEHIKITMLVDKFPFKTAQIINVISCIITILIVLITGYYSIILMNMLLNINAQWFSLDISILVVYASMPISCGLMTIRSIISIKSSVQNYLNYDPS